MKAKKKIGLRSIMMRCFYEMVAKHLARRSHLFAFCGFQAILASTHLSCPLPLLCTKLGEKRTLLGLCYKSTAISPNFGEKERTR